MLLGYAAMSARWHRLEIVRTACSKYAVKRFRDEKQWSLGGIGDRVQLANLAVHFPDEVNSRRVWHLWIRRWEMYS